ncbi:MAG: Lysophospholipase (EC 3.1.1.5) [Olavius algarvensis Gamma 1 endosymbiont]|nr:MAG: Lysophospholipase (EC 3.1.1.5) [Olavius algarvensis Gamma 1 endosymbiont]
MRYGHCASLRFGLSRPVGHPIIHLIIAALIAGCASPRLQEPASLSGHTRQLQESAGVSDHARRGAEAAITADGYRLPMRRWGDAERPQALVLALHGFNDYGNAFATLGPYLATQGILTFAYDQRGFGATAQRGLWAGEERLIADLKTLTRLLRGRHPGIPLFLLGESMGSAVIMASAARTDTGADGVILVAPAVWSRDTMNPIQGWVLEVAAHTFPSLVLTGRGLSIRPSDNSDMLRAYNADPLVIKGTRVDALWGVTNIMDLAMAGAVRLPGPTLVLYGEHDEIIPGGAFCALLDRIPADRRDIRIVLYREGWHMLTRDLQGERVLADIAAWLRRQDGHIPSGEEVQVGSRRLEHFCRG